MKEYVLHKSVPHTASCFQPMVIDNALMNIWKVQKNANLIINRGTHISNPLPSYFLRQNTFKTRNIHFRLQLLSFLCQPLFVSPSFGTNNEQNQYP